MQTRSGMPTIGILTVIGSEQLAIKEAFGIQESDRVAGRGSLWYEKIIHTRFNGDVLVQLHAQGEPGNTASASDATRIIGSGVRFMLLCGIAAGTRGKV